MLVLATAMMFASLANECQAQSNPCGAASFYLYGNYQNQEVLLHFIGINGSLYNGNPSEYLYDALLSSIYSNTNAPIAEITAQIVINSNGVAQDGPLTFISPSSPHLQELAKEVLLWGFNYYNNNDFEYTNILTQEQSAFYATALWQSTWYPVIALFSGQFPQITQWGDAYSPISDLIPYITQDHLNLTPDPAALVGDTVGLLTDLLGGSDKLQQDQAFTNNIKGQIISILQTNGVVLNSNFTGPDFS